MNERIRELRREAEKWVSDNFSTDELDPYEWWEKEEQKFAELIVEECAEQSMSIGRYHDISGITPDLAIAIAVGLKKHFGVKE